MPYSGWKEMNTVTLTQRNFLEIVDYLRLHPQHIAVCDTITNAILRATEIICGPPRFMPCAELHQYRRTSSQHVELGLTSSSFAQSGWRTLLLLALKAGFPYQANGREHIIAQVALDKENLDCASGFIAFPKNGQSLSHNLSFDGFVPIYRLKIVGSGMREILTADARSDGEVPPYERERWSRAMGALGGLDVWKRFVSLHYCIVGVGRTGSLVAHSLSKMGVKQLTLVDPDRVELHNLDAMDGVTEKSLGQYKVEAVKRRLQRERKGQKVTAIPKSVVSAEAFQEMLTADILISCVDSNVARLLTGAVAFSYAKPLLDIGAGVFAVPAQVESNGRLMGADVRLILPGDGCLFCVGGVRNPGEALVALRNELRGVTTERPDWHVQRAGSLRSLNETAAHLGLGLIENFVKGTLEGSTWLRLEYTTMGIPTLTPMPVGNVHPCSFCSIWGMA